MLESILEAVSHPILAYTLFIIGVYGLFLECFAPGFIFPSVLGAIALFFGIYGLCHLLVSGWALVLLLVGLGAMIWAEFTSFQLQLRIVGVLVFFVGSIFLVEPKAIPALLILCVTGVTAFFFFWVLRFSMSVRNLDVVSGKSGMIGQVVIIDSNGEWLLVMGERWRYASQNEVKPGQSVRVLRVEGLILQVELVSEQGEK